MTAILEKLDPRKLDVLFDFLDTRILTIPSLIIFMTLMFIGGVIMYSNHLHRKYYHNFLIRKNGLVTVTSNDGSLRYGKRDNVTGEVSVSNYVYLTKTGITSDLVLLLNLIFSLPLSLAYACGLGVFTKKRLTDEYFEKTNGEPTLMYKIFDKLTILYSIFWFILSLGLIITLLLYIVYRVANVFL